MTAVINSKVRNNAPGKFIRLSKGYTHYETAGAKTGPVVLFIHGFSVPYYMWDHNFRVLAEAGFRVIRYDLYGRGLSDRPRTIYNQELFVTQIQELLDALAITGPIHIIATSMGGAVAAAFTATHPERVAKIVLIDPLFEKWRIGLLRVPLIGELLMKQSFLPAAPQQQLKDFFQPEKFQYWADRFKEQMQFDGFGAALLSTLRYFISKDPTPNYEAIAHHHKSVLLLWGTADQTTPPIGAKKLCQILRPEFHWIDQAGHLPHYEQPQIVNSHLRSFLTKQQLTKMATANI